MGELWNSGGVAGRWTPSLLAAVDGFMVWLTAGSLAVGHLSDRLIGPSADSVAWVTSPHAPDETRLRVGFVPGVTLTKWRTIWQQRFPKVPLDVVEVSADDPQQVLDDRAVDLCFVRLPVVAEGFHVIRLYDEVPVAWVAKDHPLALFDEVSHADLADENVIEAVDRQTIELAAQEDAVLLVPMSIARSHSRRDLVYRPVIDAPHTTVALAWRVDNPHESIDEFIGVVRGRTENSSRTAQARAGRQPPAKKPKLKRTAAPKADRPTVRGKRRGRR